MTTNPAKLITLTVAFLSLLLSFSCAKDNDLFLEAVLEEEEEVVDIPADEDPDFENTNKIDGTYNPSSAAEIMDPSKANFRAIITNSFDCTNCEFAPNQTIEPAGGSISGTNINLNGAFIENTFKNAFTATVSFTEPYRNSRLSPETFGANGSDGVADDIVLSTLIAQSEYAVGQSGAIYIKNDETIHNRSGVFDWDMNGAVLRTTNGSGLSHGSGTNNQNIYLIRFQNLDVRITNGTFDGQDIASRCVYFDGVDSYYLDNMVIENYLSPAGAFARGIGIRVSTKDNFTGGSILNSTIQNIGAASDGNANNVPFGVSKGITMGFGSNNPSEQLIQNCIIDNIYGDDAEGIYSRPTFGFNNYDHVNSQANITVDNNVIKACQRRAIKANASDMQITNNLIESATNDWEFSGAQATLVHIFPLSPQVPLHNVNVIGNTIRTIGDARNPAFHITEASNCLIENNIMEANYIMLQRNVGFGNGSNTAGSNSGYLDNTIVFRNNTITNYFILLNNYMISVNGGFVWENNTINLDIDRGVGNTWGAFRRAFPSRGDIDGFTFKDTQININQTVGTGTIFSVLMTEASNLTNTVWDNIDVNYTGTATPPTYPFMRIGSNPNVSMDSSNTIINCNITGASGSNSIDVSGNGSPAITNSYDNNGNSITVN